MRADGALVALPLLTVVLGCQSAPGAERGVLPLRSVPASVDSADSLDSARRSQVSATADTPADGDWPMATKDHANTRYSALDEITPGNVRRLRLAWTLSTGRKVGHEGAPLVVGARMYFVTPFPHEAVALDLTRPGAPPAWTYRPPQQRAAKGVACCDLVNRGPAYADGRLFFVTLDNQAVALSTDSGEELWRVGLGDINRGESMTMAPLVVKGKVLVGNSGGEFGVRGWVKALDAESGRTVWTAYGTGPDADVLIGPEFRPFYHKDTGRDLGERTWPGDKWKTGGATMWGWFSYDPDLDLIYYGTGNAGPWNPDLRPGDNKWAATIFARDPDTGMARWAYQIDPHNEHDYDAINESMLLDVRLGERVRQALFRVERNGYLYLMDRASGELLAVDNFVPATAVLGVDLRTGQPRKDPAKAIRMGETVRGICPAVPGSKSYSPAAFSPGTGLVYIPFNNLCMDVLGVEANYIAGTPYIGTVHTYYGGPGGHRGGFFAWDPARRRKQWQIEERFPVWSGALATAGDIVFYGTMDRWFKAVNARSGEVLWRFQTGSGIIGQPITYRGPDGKQYVAIFDGVGGWAGNVVSAKLDPRDPLAGDGFVGAMQDLPRYTDRGGTLYVFALP